jgi:hypothetical protein
MRSKCTPVRLEGNPRGCTARGGAPSRPGRYAVPGTEPAFVCQALGPALEGPLPAAATVADSDAPAQAGRSNCAGAPLKRPRSAGGSAGERSLGLRPGAALVCLCGLLWPMSSARALGHFAWPGGWVCSLPFVCAVVCGPMSCAKVPGLRNLRDASPWPRLKGGHPVLAGSTSDGDFPCPSHAAWPSSGSPPRLP